MRKIFYLFLLAGLLVAGNANAQCTYSICLYDTFGDGWNGNSATVLVNGAPVLTNITLAAGSGPQCFNFTVNNGQTINVVFNATGSWQGECNYTVFNGTGGTGTVMYDSPNGSIPSSNQSVNNGCGTPGGGGPSPCTGGGNNNCVAADPFCTGTAYNYCNTTGVASMGSYSCLGSTPNPMWMYLQVQTSGGIDIFIEQFSNAGSPIDVDFALYGPYTSVANACANITGTTPTVDCSYSAAPTETANIANAIAGQWYMLLITNFNGQAGYIEFSQTGGSGATNCSIVGPCSITTTQTNVTCNGGANGSITATPNGTGPFSYSWSPAPGSGQGTATASGLSAGTYTVTVTASGGATCTTSATITQPTAITGTTSRVNVLCNGGSTGSITVNASGGTAPYNISWTGTTSGNPGGTEIAASGGSYTLNNLPAGNYTITITDANGCTRVLPVVNVTQPTAIASTLTPTHVLCNGGTTGAIAVNASGGTAGYNVSWTGPSNGAPAGTEIAASGGTYNMTGLAAGTYTVTITDANGCTRTATSTITQPTAIASTLTPTHVLCNGGTTGAIAVNASGGTAGYNVSWTGPSNGNPGGTEIAASGGSYNMTNLGAGTYTITITDANGCTRTATSTINQPAAIASTLTPTNILCNGGTTGAIAVNASGGTAGYNVSWTGPTNGNPGGTEIGASGGTYNMTNLGAGTFTVTVTDANGCTRTATSTITQPTAIASTLTPTNILCNGGTTGAIAVNASGGTAGYNVSWTGPSTGNPAGTEIAASGGSYNMTNLGAGTFTVTVTDANGCTRTATSTITQPTAIAATLTPTHVLCNGATTGAIAVNASGGTAGYNVSWTGTSSGNPAGTEIAASGGTFNMANLGAGNYTVTITDANGCTRTATTTITQPTAIATTLTPTNILCNGGTTGAIAVNASGGTAGYNVSWTGPSTGNPAGTEIAASGGTFNMTNLAAGSFTVTVTDANGCTRTATSTVTQPTPVSVTLTPTNILCNGGTTGAIAVNASGGTAGYNVSWSGPSNGNPAGTEIGSSGGTFNMTNLGAGAFTVTVTDANGCTATASATITQPTLVATTLTPTNILCNGGATGAIAVNASGGTAGYNVSWTGPSTGNPAGTEIAASGGTFNMTNLAAGSFTVTVTDANGCTRTATTTITQPTPVSVTLTPTNVVCNGNTTGSIAVNASGGTAGYNVSWTGPSTGNPAGTEIAASGGTYNVSNLGAGTFTVTVTDANGCTFTATSTITQPTPLTATISGTNVSCNGGNNGTATVVPAGGPGGNTIVWSPAPGGGQGTTTATGLTAQTYTVTITSAGGCSTTTSFTPTQPTPLTATISGTNVSCNGGNNGTATVVPAGGPGGNTIVWSPAPGGGQGTTTATGLTAQTYTVTVTSTGGCSTTTSFTPTQPTPLTATISGTNVSCNGGNNGTATVVPAGGPGGNTFSWSPAPGGGQGTATATGLTAQAYTVTVTSTGGCTATATYTPTQPALLSTTMGPVTNVNCNGGNNGAVSVTASGGTTNYTYNWSPAPGAGQGTAAASSLTAGTYTVTVTDANGCTSTASATITQPSALTVTASSTNVSCNAGTNGTATATPVGGSGGNTFSWSPSGGTAATATGLVAGTYTVTVTNTGGCTATASATITEPTAITLTTSSTNTNCGLSTGSVTVAAAGGSGGYSYSWNTTPVQTTATATALPSGTYTVTVTDANACTSTATVSVNNNAAPSISEQMASHTDVNCFGGNNGSATVTTSGGTAPLSISWSPSGGTSSTATGLTAGTYTVTVTDANACAASVNVVITQPTALTATMGSPTNVLCNGGNNGAVSVTAAGGTTAYTYNWTPAPGVGQGTANISSLTAGTYSVTVTDANGCTATSSATITQPTVLTATMGAPTMVSCNGANDGSVSVSTAGGSAPYTFSWTPSPGGGQGTASVSGLSAGAYTVTVTDNNACTATASVTITEPTLLTATISGTNVSCNGGADGTATVVPVGGPGGNTIVWSPAPGGGQGTATATGLTAQTYTVTVTSTGGCSTTTSFTPTEPTLLTATISGTNVSCNGGNDGTATVVPAGGPGGNTIVWSPAPGAGQGTTSVSGLTAQTYTVTITSTGGCSTTTSFTPTQPAALAAAMGTPTNVSCNGANDGSVSVNATGGTIPYTYIWSPAPGAGQGTGSVSSLAAGTYSVTITDANGCTQTNSATITEPAVLTVTTSTTNATCGASNGSATAIANGGSGAYTYSWSPSGGTTATAGSLAAGSYTVTVTDANGCTQSATANVVNDAAPIISEVMASHTNVSCFGGADGSAEVNTSGGTAPLSIAWSPSGGTGSTATGLSANSYTVTVTDANGCSSSVTIDVTQPSVLTAVMGVPTMVSCNGGSDGSVSVTANGGTIPYSYSWSPAPGVGQTSSSPSSMAAGVYTVTITDANGCTQTSGVTITEPTPLTATTSGTNVSCFGGNDGAGTLTTGGGTSPYTISWSPAPGTGQGTASVGTLSAGIYTATVTDANGCTITSDLTITEPALLTVSVSVVDANCGQSNGSATASTSGGTGASTFVWTSTPAQTTATASGIPAGTYTVTATDANGCTASTNASVGTIAGPVATATVNSNVTGAGLCNGSGTISVTSGTAPFTILWDNGNTNATANDLCEGNNCATVTDAAGCTSIACILITEPAPLDVTLTPTNLNCFNQCIGQVSSSTTGGVAPYSYVWSNGATSANLANVCAGTYTVTVTDANGNTATATSTVTEPADIVITSATASPALCFGSCDGGVTASANGGTGALVYTWTGGLSGAAQTGLCAGTYNLVVNDANGCSETASATVTEPTLLTVSTSTTNANCGNADGSATAVGAGGTAPYTYVWSAGSTSDIQTAIAAGSYTVTVTDANGCTATASATVGNNPAGSLAVNLMNNVLCNGAGNGSAVGVMTGGTGPFQYSWNTTPVQTTALANNLLPGTWTLTVTDANGCLLSESITITEPALLVATPSAVDVNCNGGTDGSLGLSVSGGNPAYNLTWTDGGGNIIGTTPNQTGLPAGTYTVSVNDDNGCNSTASVTINEPPVYTVSTTTIDVKCNGACDGNVTATVTGGTAPYTYQWDDPLAQTTNGAFFLCPGNYTVTITDDHNCVLTSTATVNEPTALANTVSSVDAHCQQNDGSGCANFSGGIPPYSINWLANGATTSCVNNLFSGTYLVEVTDANLCRDTAIVQILDIAGPSATIVAQTEVSCNGLNDGSATVNMVGGTGIFTVQWDANANNQTTPTASNLSAGTYSVNITDAAGCAASTNVTITEPALVIYIPTTTNASCFDYCDGEISIAVTGGVTPYTYDWRDNTNTAIGSGTSSVSNLCDGTYTLMLSDANGCNSIVPYTITEPVEVTGTIAGTDNTCFESCDGTATITPVSGQAPFTFSWDDPSAQTSATAGNLCDGTYTGVLTDADGCFNTYTVTIAEPALLTATITSSGNVSCAGVCDGFAGGTATGGTAPYSYAWSNGVSGQMNNNICVGTYVFTVTDANGCTASDTITIIEPSALAVAVTGTDNTCFQSCDGTMNANVTGGTAPYAIQWDNATFATTATVTNVCAGFYTVVTTDANGCSVTGTITIDQPDQLDFAAAIANNAFCGQNNGSICAVASGGVLPYTYQWDDPASQTTSCANNLFSGCYTLTLTDGNGCIKDSLLCINDIPGPTLTVTSFTDVTCQGASDGSIVISVVGGTNPLVIEWLDGSGNVIPALTGQTSVSTFSGDTYGIQVTDSANCVVGTTQFIFEPTSVFAAITASSQPNCFGGCDGTATVSSSGGVLPHTISWTSGANPNANLNTGLCAGTYDATVTDANGCSFTATAVIGEPTQLVVNTSLTENVSCNSFCDGLIDLTVSGATPPYFYSWTNNVSVASTATGLCAGNYVTDVTDNNGCLVTVNNTITEPAQLVVDVVTTPSTCTQCNGIADATATGGTTPYAYSWTNGSNTTAPNNTGICPGATSVTVTDANGCVVVVNDTIHDLAGPTITSMAMTEVLCFGGSDGTATPNIIGGSAPLSFTWDDPNAQTTQTATNLVTGLYCVVVTDTNNCSATNCIDVTEPSLLGAVGDLDVTICYGDSTQVWASGTGGSPAYTINWQTPGMTGAGPIMVYPAITTTYCFTVTDANGCLSPQECVTITVNPPLDIDMSPSATICSGTPTTITAEAIGGNGGPYTFTWTDEFGNSYTGAQTGNNSEITVTPTVNTWYFVELNDGCSLPFTDSVQILINENPIVFLNAVDTAGCAPFTAQFILNTDIGADFSYDFDCDGTPDYVGSTPNATYTYTNPGTYDVCVTVVSSAGCITTLTQSELIDVYPVPEADFMTNPTITTILNPTVSITNTSNGNPVLYQWDFGDGNTLTGIPGGVVPPNTNGGNTSGTYDNPMHTYADTGTFDVTLIITNEFGCTDEITYQVIVEGDYIFFAPNTFTPNGDGKNDVFIPMGIMIGGDEYELLVFNRWGELIFESHQPGTGWDGNHKGVPAKQDVYVWKVKAFDFNGVQHDYIGHITLLR